MSSVSIVDLPAAPTLWGSSARDGICISRLRWVHKCCGATGDWFTGYCGFSIHLGSKRQKYFYPALGTTKKHFIQQDEMLCFPPESLFHAKVNVPVCRRAYPKHNSSCVLASKLPVDLIREVEKFGSVELEIHCEYVSALS